MRAHRIVSDFKFWPGKPQIGRCPFSLIPITLHFAAFYCTFRPWARALCPNLEKATTTDRRDTPSSIESRIAVPHSRPLIAGNLEISQAVADHCLAALSILSLCAIIFLLFFPCGPLSQFLLPSGAHHHIWAPPGSVAARAMSNTGIHRPWSMARGPQLFAAIRSHSQHPPVLYHGGSPCSF